MSGPRSLLSNEAEPSRAAVEALGSEAIDNPAVEVEERLSLDGRSLREHTARGVIINAGFHVGIALLSLAQKFAVAAFLTATEFGIWGIVFLILTTLSWLKEIGIGDKFIQQSEPDQELAFQKAFTLEVLYTSGFVVFVWLTLPLFALAYGTTQIILPAVVLSLCLILGALTSPIWIAFREMRFVRQRTLEAVNPIVGTVVMIALAAGGAGYWAIVIGMVAGAFAGAAVALVTCPYKLAWRFESHTLRSYVSFSVPLLISAIAGIGIVQGTLLVGNQVVGLAGVGALTLAASVAAFSERVDEIISRTIYPAVCAVRDRVGLMHETFVKSNRLALMFGLPFGFGLLLFAPDLVNFVLGSKWTPAIGLLQALGMMTGVRQIAFNWGLFYNAVGNTRPQATIAVILLGVFCVITVPAMFAWELNGYIVGMSISVCIEIGLRAYYLRRMFTGFSIWRHLIRAFAPSVPAVAVVLLARYLGPEARTEGEAILELCLYVATTVAATLVIERRLLREVGGYVTGRKDAAAGVPADSAFAGP
jgi:O-antigen/teichoic acid export membrane protein